MGIGAKERQRERNHAAFSRARALRIAGFTHREIAEACGIDVARVPVYLQLGERFADNKPAHPWRSHSENRRSEISLPEYSTRILKR